MRKLIGMIILLVILALYIALAITLGQFVTGHHWLLDLVFYVIAGVIWAFPLKPLMKWMNAKDEPLPSTDVE